MALETCLFIDPHRRTIRLVHVQRYAGVSGEQLPAELLHPQSPVTAAAVLRRNVGPSDLTPERNRRPNIDLKDNVAVALEHPRLSVSDPVAHDLRMHFGHRAGRIAPEIFFFHSSGILGDDRRILQGGSPKSDRSAGRRRTAHIQPLVVVAIRSYFWSPATPEGVARFPGTDNHAWRMFPNQACA